MPGRSRLDISVDSDFPSQLGADTFYLTAAGSGDVLAELAVGPGAQHGKLEIDLARLESEALGAGWKAATLSLTASHAYRPITIPGMGSMMDRLSFRISAKKYD